MTTARTVTMLCAPAVESFQDVALMATMTSSLPFTGVDGTARL